MALGCEAGTLNTQGACGRLSAMRKRTKRKHHDPDQHPLCRAMLAGAHASAHDLAGLQVQELLSLAALKAGQAHAIDVRGLRRRVLIAAHMGRQGIGLEVLQLVEPARRVLDVAATRPDAAPADAEGVAALVELLDLHDQQRQAVPLADYDAAIHAALNQRRW